MQTLQTWPNRAQQTCQNCGLTKHRVVKCETNRLVSNDHFQLEINSFLIVATFTPTQQRPPNPPNLPTNNNLIKQHVSSPQRFQPQVTQPQQQQLIAKQNQQQSFRPFRPQNATMIQTGFGQTNTQVYFFFVFEKLN